MSMRIAFLAVAGHVQVTTGALPYALEESYVGEDFFDKFNFYTGLDPSSGSVKYVGRGEAFEEQFVKATEERVYLGADKTSVVEGARRSVRIQSVATYNQGLFIARIDHVPTGCGTWPAFWMYGEDVTHLWPEKGEYDIIESVHEATRTLTTLHTDPNCDQSFVSAGGGSSVEWDTGSAGTPADNCDVSATDQFKNQGCSQLGPPGSVGAAFNARNGGTYAAEWDPEAMHIRTWFWPSGEEPSDLATHRPNPDDWGAPYSRFSLSPMTCPAGHFSDMRLVFNVNFCGDLGASKFGEMCPEYAALTCEEFIAQHPERLAQAFWSIRALNVYQRKATSPQSPFVVMGDSPNGVNPVSPTQPSTPFEELVAKHAWLIVVGITGGLLIIGVVASLVAANLWRKMHRGGMMAPTSPLMLPSRGPPPAQSPLVSMRDPDGATSARDRLDSWGGNTARDRVDSWGSTTRDRLDSWQSVGRSRAGSWNGPDRPNWSPGPGSTRLFDP